MTNPTFPAELLEATALHPYPLLFASLSGAHLYGFPSRDSDYDLRGAHILPPREVLALEPARDTIEQSGPTGGIELDFVTHDVKKFFHLLLKHNGYVLEQLYSPLVIVAMPAHAQLRQLARGCITRHHSRHYIGFATTQWDLFEKSRPRKLKPLLYMYRVLMTGIHLMQTGEVEAKLVNLNEKFKFGFLTDLVERKLSGTEDITISDPDVEFHRGEYARLLSRLESASSDTALPDHPTCRPQLSSLLLELRTNSAKPRL